MPPKKAHPQTISKLNIPHIEKYNPNLNPPRFSFKYLIKHNDFGFESLQKDHKISLSNTLYRLSQFTWQDLYTQNRHKKGYEIIKPNSLKFKLPVEVPNYVSIIVFRFDDNAPMIGYRSSYGTFYIIAFDTKFKAYKHG